MATGNIPQGVGQTAIGVARIRARESERADRLFDDPYAEAFVAAAPAVAAPRATPPGAAAARHAPPGEPASLGAIFQARVAIRTRFFDDYLLAACGAGCRQVVLLAVGMDTRGDRLTARQRSAVQ